MKIGTKVIKNEDTWVPNDFDGWGRGIGIGEVVRPPFSLDDGGVDVRWPNGRCFEHMYQLIDVTMNCVLGNRVETLETVADLYEKGHEGTVVGIVGFGIDIRMDSGTEIRVINSDFPKHYKVI